MRTAIFIFVAICCTIMWTQAQDVRFIPKIGFNYARLTHTKLENPDPYSGLNLGVGVERSLKNQWALESGLFYSKLGQDYFVEVEDSDYRVSLKYLTIPFILKYYIFRGFHVFSGPQLGINLIAKNKKWDSEYGKWEAASIKKQVNLVDLSVGTGAGYQFKAGLLLSFSWQYGTIKAIKHTGEHNSWLLFNLGWRL